MISGGSVERQRPDDPPVVIYDLDGVVTRKDSFTWLLVRRLRASPKRMLQAAPSFVQWLVAATPEGRASAARRIATVALAGMREDEYHELARVTGEYIGADASWIRPAVVRRMREQHAAGVRIVVATASEQRLAEALLTRAGAPFDTLSASQLAVTAAGPEVLDHRIGTRKADALRELGIDLGRAEFVTDSATDLPTARLASTVVLVAASRRTEARFAREGIDAATLDLS